MGRRGKYSNQEIGRRPDAACRGCWAASEPRKRYASGAPHGLNDQGTRPMPPCCQKHQPRPGAANQARKRPQLTKATVSGLFQRATVVRRPGPIAVRKGRRCPRPHWVEQWARLGPANRVPGEAALERNRAARLDSMTLAFTPVLASCLDRPQRFPRRWGRSEPRRDFFQPRVHTPSGMPSCAFTATLGQLT